MKTLILVIALASLVALSSARPHRGRGGPGRRDHPKPCRIVFTNGTEVNEECPDFGGLFVCEEVDLSRFDDMPRRPRKLQDVTALSVCLPKLCTQDSDCNTIDANSVCTDRPVKPDGDMLEPLIEACFPDRRHRPDRPDMSDEDENEVDEDGDEDDEDEEDTRPLRCSIPPAMHIARRACLMTYDGEDIGKPCRGPFGERTCNATVACTVSIAGKDAALHFCERPERPQRPFGSVPFGGNADEDGENTENRRPFANGNFRGPRPFGRNRPFDDEASENGQFGERQFGGGQFANGGNGNFQRFSRRGRN